MKTKSICTPSYNTAKQDFFSLIPVGNNYIFIIVVMTWLAVVLLSILEVLLINKKPILKNSNDKVALGIAALMFSGALFYLYNDNFKKDKFCLMNKNDPFCKRFNETNCFTQDRSLVFADDFGFGGFIEIGSGFGLTISYSV